MKKRNYEWTIKPLRDVEGHLTTDKKTGEILYIMTGKCSIIKPIDGKIEARLRFEKMDEDGNPVLTKLGHPVMISGDKGKFKVSYLEGLESKYYRIPSSEYIYNDAFDIVIIGLPKELINNNINFVATKFCDAVGLRDKELNKCKVGEFDAAFEIANNMKSTKVDKAYYAGNLCAIQNTVKGLLKRGTSKDEIIDEILNWTDDERFSEAQNLSIRTRILEEIFA